MFWRSNDPESSYGGRLGWCPTSEQLLEETEAHLLAGVKSIGPGVFVDIGPVIDSRGDRVLTYRANTASTRTPILLMHGFAGGSALFCLNIDDLAEDRPVYVIDLVGFGRSSRPRFSSDPYEVEQQFVRTIEAWRKVMGLDKFYLLGHSFGGYLSTLYAMKHPERVEHLILVDPWGFPPRPPGYKLPFYARPVEVGAACILPLFALRAAGPLGYLYLRMVPPFCTRSFHNITNAQRTMTDYFYHMNVKKPSGEKAFHCLMAGIAWGKLPMMDRMSALRKEVPITFLYGEKSWVWRSTGYTIQKDREPSYVDVQVVAGAGHAVMSEQPKIFNAIVRRVLYGVDTGTTPSNPLTGASIRTKDISGNTHLNEDALRSNTIGRDEGGGGGEGGTLVAKQRDEEENQCLQEDEPDCSKLSKPSGVEKGEAQSDSLSAMQSVEDEEEEEEKLLCNLSLTNGDVNKPSVGPKTITPGKLKTGINGLKECNGSIASHSLISEFSDGLSSKSRVDKRKGHPSSFDARSSSDNRSSSRLKRRSLNSLRSTTTETNTKLLGTLLYK